MPLKHFSRQEKQTNFVAIGALRVNFGIKGYHIYYSIKGRVLTNFKFEYFYSNFPFLTLTFSKVPIEKYGKTPNFSSRQKFYFYFQNPSENAERVYHPSTLELNDIKLTLESH